MQDTAFRVEAASMQKKVALMILQKQKATMAIALSLANDKNLITVLEKKHMSADYYKDLISNFEKETLYKNVWINLVDNKGTSIYRSWSDLKGDNLLDIRDDLRHVFLTKKITYSISAGMFDLSIKSMVPIFKNDRFLGVLEVITHFNSIVKNLQSSNIGSVVIVAKEHNKQLKYPFTKLFINNYYVANIDAPKHFLEYLKTNGVEKYFNDSYKVENGYIVASYPIKSIELKDIAYFIMFKNTSALDNAHVDFFTFKWIAVFMLLGLSVLFIISNIVLIKNRKQKMYYRNILDTASNIVIINDGEKALDVNKTFFKYFYKYNDLQEFLKDYSCICDLFVKENGYLQSTMDSMYWIKYIIQNSDKMHKAKVKYLDKIYYFSISGALISQEKNHCAVVFSDITKEEEYQRELLELTIKDSLTGIYNRHYFDQKINDEISRVKRYKYPLSLIMFDIDYFKNVNDEHGHAVGDTVLIAYSQFISSLLRKTDIFCRTGGEEFIILLTYTTISEAQHIAEKLRHEVENYKKILPITISFGVTQYKEDESMQSVLKRVDDALYQAKESGRNKVVVLD